MIEIVSATRLPEGEFWNKSALGLSLRRLSFDRRLKPEVFFSNSKGLSEIYNNQIISADEEDILVFVHDDVWVDDFFLGDHVV